MRYFSTSFFLLATLIFIVCGIYPFALWCVGQTFFPFQANGSMLKGIDGKIIGSRLIAQPFTKNEYFQPRPSAASYDASASASSALAASNYALRDRVARSLGPMVKYADGTLVAPDIEKWFQLNQFYGTNGIVAQWATMHSALAQKWVKADPVNAKYVDTWSTMHIVEVAQFVKNNPNTVKPRASDLAVVFFQSFAKENPGKFPVNVNGVIIPLSTGLEIQAIFFDMWRQDNQNVTLQMVPADMVTTSASGLDPHISMQNAQLQLQRVTMAIAVQTKRDLKEIVAEVGEILHENSQAPFSGFVGESFVNVLEVNLVLQKNYQL